MSGSTVDLDQANVEALAHDFLDAIHEFSSGASQDNKSVLEILNALAFAAAVMLRGTREDPNARQFLERAIDAQLALFRSEGVGNDG